MGAQRQKSSHLAGTELLSASGDMGRLYPRGHMGEGAEPPDWLQLIKTELLHAFTKAKYSCAGCALHKGVWMGLNLPSFDCVSANQTGVSYFSQRGLCGPGSDPVSWKQLRE